MVLFDTQQSPEPSISNSASLYESAHLFNVCIPRAIHETRMIRSSYGT